MRREGLDKTTREVVSKVEQTGRFEGRLYGPDLNNFFPHVVDYVVKLIPIPQFRLGLRGGLVHQDTGVKTNFTGDLQLEIVSVVHITSPVSAQAIIEMTLENAADKTLLPTELPKLNIFPRGRLARAAIRLIDLTAPREKLDNPTLTSREALQELFRGLRLRKRIQRFEIEIVNDPSSTPCLDCLIDTCDE